MITRLLVELLLAVAVGVAVYLAATGSARRSAVPAGAPLKGFAGWLLVLAIVQWLAVLVLAGDLLRGGATLVEAIGHLALLGFVLATALAMMRRHRLFPALLRIELVLLVVLPTLFWATPETGSYVTEPKLWIAAALRFV